MLARTIVCALSTIIWCGHVFATQVNDPNGTLAKVDAFLGTALFEERLKCGSNAVYTQHVQDCQYDCGEFGCGGVCTKVDNEITKTVSECTHDSVKIYGDDGSILEMPRSLYEQIHGNLARPFLEQLEALLRAQGSVTLDAGTQTTYKLAPGTPQEKVLPAINLEGRFHLNASTPGDMDFLITVVKDVPGVAQIARFRIMSETWFRLKESPQ